MSMRRLLTRAVRHVGSHRMAVMTGLDYVLVGVAGVAAGFVNALAGGGTLISFPSLVAVGIPAVAANVTNTVALSPGYFGATLAQWKDLEGQRRRLWLTLPAAAVGGLVGGLLLLNTGERVFREMVPFLILLACFLLAIQERLRGWLAQRSRRDASATAAEQWVALPVSLAAVYGGYFGAGLSVIVLATLGLALDDNLKRLNALKQAVSFSVNIAAAIFFLFSGRVVWPAAAVMAVGALLGGAGGGKLAGLIAPAVLRRVVIVVGCVVAGVYLIR